MQAQNAFSLIGDTYIGRHILLPFTYFNIRSFPAPWILRACPFHYGQGMAFSAGWLRCAILWSRHYEMCSHFLFTWFILRWRWLRSRELGELLAINYWRKSALAARDILRRYYAGLTDLISAALIKSIFYLWAPRHVESTIWACLLYVRYAVLTAQPLTAMPPH